MEMPAQIPKAGEVIGGGVPYIPNIGVDEIYFHH